MRIIVAGSGLLGVSIMEPLLESRHSIAALLQNGRKTPRWQRPLLRVGSLLSSDLPDPARLALRRRIPVVWLEGTQAEHLKRVGALEPDLIIACGFSIIFKKPLLDLPRIGCINVHSSLLPRHRGPAPFAHVILAGDTESGITFHAMDAGIDTGPILDQGRFEVGRDDTGMSVYRNCCELARERIVDVVDRIEGEGLRGTPQGEDEASYDPPVTREDFALDWSRPAEELERIVRASDAYYPATFPHGRKTIQVTQAEAGPGAADEEPGTLVGLAPCPRIATGSGTLIIRSAYVRGPLSGPWPAGLSPRQLGEKIE